MNILNPFAVTLREAEADDAPAVERLFRGHLAALGVEPDDLLDSDMAQFPFGYREPGARFLVATRPEGVVGMAGLRRSEIRRVFVAEAWRGRRIARLLIMDLVRQAELPPDRRLWAVIGRQNEPSRRAFLACGFVATGRSPQDGRHAHCEIFELVVPHTLNQRPPGRLAV